MVKRAGLEAIPLFPVSPLGCATDVVFHAGRRHQIALVRGVDQPAAAGVKAGVGIPRLLGLVYRGYGLAGADFRRERGLFVGAAGVGSSLGVDGAGIVDCLDGLSLFRGLTMHYGRQGWTRGPWERGGGEPALNES
jgi:hypothetical protein